MNLLSGYAALFVRLAEHSLPGGIPLEKNSDNQSPRGLPKQNENQSPEEELASLPESWCLAFPWPSYPARKK